MQLKEKIGTITIKYVWQFIKKNYFHKFAVHVAWWKTIITFLKPYFILIFEIIILLIIYYFCIILIKIPYKYEKTNPRGNHPNYTWTQKSKVNRKETVWLMKSHEIEKATRNKKVWLTRQWGVVPYGINTTSMPESHCHNATCWKRNVTCFKEDSKFYFFSSFFVCLMSL